MTDIVKITSPAKPLQVVNKINEAVDGINNKQDKLVSGNNIKTINNTSLLGSGNIEITTGSTYTQGTGISIVNNTINHSNSITAGTVGTSSATSGSTLAVPYINYDSEGHITGKGTHTHTVTGFLTSSNVTSSYSQTGTDPINGTGVKKALDTLSIPTVTDTYSATSSNAMSGKAVASAISGKVNGAPLSNTSSHFFGVSTSAATDTEKVVSIPSITELTAGVAIIVLPTITSTVADATLKLNNFAAYPMRYQNSAITTSTDTYTWTANTPSVFVFDGEYWRFVCQGYRQVYSTMSVSEGTTGTATTGRVVRADYLKSTILGTKLTGLSTSTTGTVAATDTILVGMGKLQATKADKSAIPTVNNATLTIQKNSSNVATFTANASSNVTANIIVPTKTSDLTNDDGFITGISSSDVTTALGYTPYDASNPSGYTTNTGTVTSVNNINPINGNVTISIPTVDQSYSGTSTNAQSGVAVKSAIDSAISSVYKAAGSIAYASLPTPTASNEGYVYNITDSFTTDSRFVEGSGKSYPAGTNVVIINTGSSTYKFDVLAGMIDLSGYVPTTRTVNGKALSSNITLTASDVSALPSSTFIPTISDTYSATSSNGMSGKAVASAISTKQDTISDLATIRSGAAAGATALQQNDVVSTYSATGTAPVNGKAVASAISGKVDNSELANYVPTSRTINNKALTSNISLTASDVGAAASSHNQAANTINVMTGYDKSAGTATGIVATDTLNVALAKIEQVLDTKQSSGSYVQTSRTINGKTLSSDITLTAADVSALPSSTVIPTISDTYSATSSNGMSGKAVASAISGKANSSDLATVATSGSYNDLSNKPTIPTVNNATLTIQKNGTTVNTFTANASSNVTANITVPTKTSDLTNDSGYTTNTGTVTSVNNVSPVNGNVAISIPTVNNSTITIQKNNTTVGSFTTNASSGKTINITVPTNTNELTNGAGFITSSSLPGVATTSTAGLVKPDGTTITVDANGTISSAGGVDIDEETITKNSNDELQVVAVKNKRDDSTLPIWQGTEQQWNRGVATTWYYWQTSVTAIWTTSTMPSSAYWYSATYGNGKFVAVAGEKSDKAAYSTDGINWTASTLPSSANWQSVTYGDGKFVAVAYASSKSAYSTDGINWTASTMSSYENWWSVTYGDGKFVAVAYNSDKSAYSTDGINWTASTLPSSVNWYSVTYGDGKFVAVATSSNKSAYSTDGINWTETTLPSFAYWYSVTYGDGKFVAVTNRSESAYSTDGINWTASTLPSSATWQSVTYGDGKFVAVTYRSSKSAYSTDGINWTETTMPSSVYWQSVTYGDDKFVAVAYNSDASAIFTMGYDKCYTDTANPTTSSTIYSAPETVSSYTISSVTSGAITLSNNNTYYYDQSGNAFTYRTIGDAHPEYLCFIDGVGIKKGNTLIASATPITTTITSTSTDAEVPSAKAVYDEVGDVETLINAL